MSDMRDMNGSPSPRTAKTGVGEAATKDNTFRGNILSSEYKNRPPNEHRLRGIA